MCNQKVLRFLFVAYAIWFSSIAQGAEMRGCIKSEVVSADQMPQFRVLFAGKETMTNTEGFFSMPLEQQIHRYSLLICKNVKQNFVKTNTVRNVCMAPSDDYRYYEFEKTPQSSTWRQQEKRLDLERPIAPEGCVIVLLDPAHVSRIEPWRIDFAAQTVKLPAIVLKQEVSTSTLASASAMSLLCSLDEKPFHETVKEEVKQLAQNTNVMVALTR